MKKTPAIAAALLVLATLLNAQSALISTVLSSTVDPTTADFEVSSTVGINVGDWGYVDHELFRVIRIDDKKIRTARGIAGRPSEHGAGASIYLGTPAQFRNDDATGSCTETDSAPEVQAINITSGKLFVCASGRWAEARVLPRRRTTTTQSHEFLAGVCQGGEALSAYNLPRGNYPTPVCVGVNTNLGAVEFTAGQTAQIAFTLPEDWVSSSPAEIEYRFSSVAAGGTGSIVWNSQVGCVTTPGGTTDPVLGSSQAASVMALADDTANAVASELATQGCTPGARLIINFGLDGSTTAAGSQRLYSVRVKIKRMMTGL